jgi:hypothetical protein
MSITETDPDFPYKKIPEKGTTLEVFYRYDEKEGKIIRTTDYHEDHERIFIQQSWEFYGERTAEARKLVLDGLMSPIYYHMERLTMELNVLAPSVSLSQWRVKRHFKPNVYKKIKRSILERYAKAFDIKVEDLDKID